MNKITLKGKAADMFVRAAIEASEPPVRVQRAGSVACVESEVRNLVCYKCRGVGKVSGEVTDCILICEKCDGTGRIRITKPPNDKVSDGADGKDKS